MSDDRNAPRDLVDLIGRAFDHDLEPIPERLSDAARSAFAWRRVDAELAEILFDSAESELVGIRGTSTERRSFRYAANEFVLRVHLTEETLIAMVEPPLSVPCRIVSDGNSTDHRTDDLGELAVDLPDLPLRIEVDLPSGTIVTPWITG